MSSNSKKHIVDLIGSFGDKRASGGIEIISCQKDVCRYLHTSLILSIEVFWYSDNGMEKHNCFALLPCFSLFYHQFFTVGDIGNDTCD